MLLFWGWIFVFVIETGFLYIPLDVLELTIADQDGLELTEIHLSLPHEGWPTTIPDESSLFWLSSKGWRV